MRFREGSKVEVLNKKDVPWGSWRGAEIICGNGHTYTVRYDGNLGTDDKTLLERVSRKAIRPYPPSIEVAENWVLGDIVEVFDDFSWKMATVTRILDKRNFLVRLLGSSLEFKVGKFEIRPRQLWHDDRWIVMGKGSGGWEDRKHDERNLKNNQRLRIHIKRPSTRAHGIAQADCFPLRSAEKFQDSDVFSHRNLKRVAYGIPQVAAHNRAGKKFRAIDKEGELHCAIAADHFLSPEQVAAAAFPRELVGEKIMHSSFDSRIIFHEMDEERRNLAGAVGCSSAIELDSLDTDSVASSVGSCSVTNGNPSNLCWHTGFIEDTNVYRSDAESFSEWGYEEGNGVLPMKEKLAAEIHRLELHAYRCAMEALYASGPLSWEQEALVTSIRFFLHISNDEHLMEGQNRRQFLDASMLAALSSWQSWLPFRSTKRVFPHCTSLMTELLGLLNIQCLCQRSPCCFAGQMFKMIR